MAFVYKGIRNPALKFMLMTAFVQSSTMSKRLGAIEGFVGRKNEIIYHSPKIQTAIGTLVYFGGDIQDFKEKMLAHRDNKHHVQWNLEDTASLLHERFPEWEIVIIKPSKMELMTFSCFKNFVEVNNFGAPTHKISSDALSHLKMLLQNVVPHLNSQEVQSATNVCLSGTNEKSQKPLIIIGFSKGCVVLNQLLYAFHAIDIDPNEDLLAFVRRIKTMYWLEGGHSGASNTWIIDREILQTFASMNIAIKIHVTPYQVYCDTRPRIGKEEKIFRETLKRLGANVERHLHFVDELRSLEAHFRVLEVFEKPS